MGLSGGSARSAAVPLPADSGAVAATAAAAALRRLARFFLDAAVLGDTGDDMERVGDGSNGTVAPWSAWIYVRNEQ